MITIEIHVTRVGSNGDTYGHETNHCDASGCNGSELYFGVYAGVARGSVFSVDLLALAVRDAEDALDAEIEAIDRDIARLR